MFRVQRFERPVDAPHADPPIRRLTSKQAPPPAARQAARIAAMTARDLAYQTEPEPHAPVVVQILSPAFAAIEGLEDALALGLRHAGPAVKHAEQGVAALYLQLDEDRAARRVVRGIVEQVANQAGEQPAFALHRRGTAGEVGPGTRGLLGAERLQVDSLQVRGPLQGAEAARQQDLLDQLVEILDVALDALAQRRIAVLRQQLHGHADTGEGGAQLVRRGGEGIALRLDQRLNALRRLVEAARQRRDLVLAFDIDPGGEIARAQGLDSGLQALQPAREAAGERPGADGDGERQDAEGGEEADRRGVEYVVALGADLDEAAVRQRQHEGLATLLARARGPLLGRSQGPAQAAEQLALRPEDADAGVEVLAEAGEGGIGLRPTRAGRRQQLDQERTDTPAKFRVRTLVMCQPPAEDGERAEEHDDAEQRQIDLEEEAPSHGSSSCRGVKR